MKWIMVETESLKEILSQNYSVENLFGEEPKQSSENKTKRKRGRPRKNEVQVLTTESDVMEAGISNIVTEPQTQPQTPVMGDTEFYPNQQPQKPVQTTFDFSKYVVNINDINRNLDESIKGVSDSSTAPATYNDNLKLRAKEALAKKKDAEEESSYIKTVSVKPSIVIKEQPIIEESFKPEDKPEEKAEDIIKKEDNKKKPVSYSSEFRGFVSRMYDKKKYNETVKLNLCRRLGNQIYHMMLTPNREDYVFCNTKESNEVYVRLCVSRYMMTEWNHVDIFRELDICKDIVEYEKGRDALLTELGKNIGVTSAKDIKELMILTADRIDGDDRRLDVDCKVEYFLIYIKLPE